MKSGSSGSACNGLRLQLLPRSQPCLVFAETAQMLAGRQARCEGERFLAATSLPEAASATSYLLFLSGIEEHSAFLAPVCLFFLAGKRRQRSCVFK